MHMKYIAFAITVASLIRPVAAADVTPVVIEEIIAKVNGDIITRGELEREKRQMETELR